MPINSSHPNYIIRLNQWSKCRDVVAGEDVVKGKGDIYLPRLSDQDEQEYKAYKGRATFYGATRRTVSGLSGMIFRKPLTTIWPEGRKEQLNDLGVSGESLGAIAASVVDELLITGRVGLYVDADASGTLPYVAVYFAENILNWRTAVVNGRKVLTLVVLKERRAIWKDAYECEFVNQFRELIFDYSGTIPVYTVRVWVPRRVKEGALALKSDELVVDTEVQPKMTGGRAFEQMPFTFIGSKSLDPDELEESPLLDLANINLSHYRTSADLEHGRHFTALPTAWVAGHKLADGTTLKIGSATAWVFGDSNAKAGYLEFTGAGLGHLADAAKEKKQEMAVLGARLLEEQKAQAEAADTVRLRQSGEQSALSKVANAASEGLTITLKYLAVWLGIGEVVSLQLNKDFGVVNLNAQTLTALMAAVQGGLLSWEMWFANLKQGGVVPEDRTEDEERGAIETGGPMPTPPPAPVVQAEPSNPMDPNMMAEGVAGGAGGQKPSQQAA